MMKKVWLITGCSKRLGRKLVQEVLENDDHAGSSMTFTEEIEDYKPVLQQYKSYAATTLRKGDPYKIAKVIFDLAYHPEPPVHLVLGSDAVIMLEKADKERNDEFAQWRTVSISTDFGL